MTPAEAMQKLYDRPAGWEMLADDSLWPENRDQPVIEWNSGDLHRLRVEEERDFRRNWQLYGRPGKRD